MHSRTPKPRPRRQKKARRPPDPTGPVRSSIWLDRTLFEQITAQAEREQRKVADMIRVLVRRGLTTTRDMPPH